MGKEEVGGEQRHHKANRKFNFSPFLSFPPFFLEKEQNMDRRRNGFPISRCQYSLGDEEICGTFLFLPALVVKMNVREYNTEKFYENMEKDPPTVSGASQ